VWRDNPLRIPDAWSLAWSKVGSQAQTAERRPLDFLQIGELLHQLFHAVAGEHDGELGVFPSPSRIRMVPSPYLEWRTRWPFFRLAAPAGSGMSMEGRAKAPGLP